MKKRNGFVSNSSSSSFILDAKNEYVINNSTIDYIIIEDEDIIKNLKKFYTKYYDGDHKLDSAKKLILTEFVSDTWYDEDFMPWDEPTIYDYQEGNHDGPYDEDDYIQIENNIWLLKEHNNIENIEQQIQNRLDNIESKLNEQDKKYKEILEMIEIIKNQTSSLCRIGGGSYEKN